MNKATQRTWHNGGIQGFLSFTAFFPFDKFGIFISINKWGYNGVEQVIAEGIIASILGLPPSQDVQDPEPDRVALPNPLYHPLVPQADLDRLVATMQMRNQSRLLGDSSSYVGRYTNAAYGQVDLCDFSTNDFPEICDEAREDFKSVGITDGVGAKWLRVWGTHLYVTPVTPSMGKSAYLFFDAIGPKLWLTALVYLRSVYPDGYGYNKRPFYAETGAEAGIFVPGVGMGLYEDLDTLPMHENPTAEEVKATSQAWFDWESFE